MQSSGFGSAPVSRYMLYYIVASAIAVTAADVKQFLPISPFHITEYSQPWRLLTWQLSYVNSTEVLFAGMTVYQLRIVERLWGSNKFFSFLISTSIYTTFVPPLLLFMLRPLTDRLGIPSHLPSGPTAILFALLAQYHAAIPYTFRYRVSAGSSSPTSSTSTSTPTSAGEADGILLTSKSTSYLLPAQLALSQLPGSLIPAVVGWSVGYAWRFGLLPGCEWRWGRGLRRKNAAGAAAAGSRGSGPSDPGEGSSRRRVD